MDSQMLDSSATLPRQFYGYRLVAYSFAVCFLVSSFFLHARGVFFPQWMADFSVSRTELSFAVSMTLFTGSMCAPVMGYLIDRYPLRIIICCGAGWLACGYLLMQFVDTYFLFLLVLIPFQGLGWTATGPLVHTKLMVNWFSRNRGMALGIAIMGISVAGVITPVLNAYLAETIGWRGGYLIYATALLLIVIPGTLLLVRQLPDNLGQFPDGDSEPKAAVQGVVSEQQAGLIATYKEFLTSKAFWSVVLTFGLMNGVYSAMATHLPTYLITELSYTLYDGAFMLTVAGGFAITGKLIFGWMIDHLAAKTTVMAGVLAYLGSTLALIFSDSYAWLLVAAALFGLGFGGMVPVRSVVIARLFGAAKFSRVNGLLSFFLAPAAFWVLATGYIADVTNSYQPAFQIWFVAFLLAGLVSLLVKLPNREDAVN